MNPLHKVIYHLCSLKNRYPCKLIKVMCPDDEKSDTKVVFKVATRLNIREMKLKDLLSDPFLIDKFHPSDAVKLGFISSKDLLISPASSIEDVNNSFLDISKKLFKE